MKMDYMAARSFRLRKISIRMESGPVVVAPGMPNSNLDQRIKIRCKYGFPKAVWIARCEFPQMFGAWIENPVLSVRLQETARIVASSKSEFSSWDSRRHNRLSNDLVGCLLAAVTLKELESNLIPLHACTIQGLVERQQLRGIIIEFGSDQIYNAVDAWHPRGTRFDGSR